MTSVLPLPMINNNSMNPDIGRPGQQLLPGYVVKLLKTLKIPFGTDRTMNGVDIDPTIALVGHIVDCLGALRDVNKIYRAKGSLASRSVGTRVMFGFTAELGNILLDAITFDPPVELADSTNYYSQIAGSILNVFPEIAAQVTPSTGKVLLHHTALKTSSMMAMDSLKMVVKAFPAGAWTTDRTGALALHWITHNPHCSQEMINYIINANPKGPWVADIDGYLPLHWAVNQDIPNIDVVATLINANASAAAKACLKGSLPLHWCVNRDRPNMNVLKALLQVHPDGVRTFDKTGWLPIHQCVNRSDVSLDALSLLIELYPQGLQCPNVNGQLVLHRALDQTSPNPDVMQIVLNAFPGASKVADDEGYLPIHLALDCARPNAVIARMLLEAFPEAAFHKSKDGLLPIHCIISALHPVVEIIQLLLSIFPDSTESMAVDVIPVDETADPETWQGEWIEKRWTPLSRAIDRGLDAIVILFRESLNNTNIHNKNNGFRAGGPINNASAKTLQPQSRPPINNIIATNSVLNNGNNMDNSVNNNSKFLGGYLEQEDGFDEQRPSTGHMNRGPVGRPQQGGFSQPKVVSNNNNPAVSPRLTREMLLNDSDNDYYNNAQNSQTLKNASSVPSGGDLLKNRMPGGAVPRGNAPLGRTDSLNGANSIIANSTTGGDKFAEAKNRERDRRESRDRERGSESRHHRRSGESRDRRDRDRDPRDRDRSSSRRDHHRTSSRNGDRYYEDDDRRRNDRDRRERDSRGDRERGDRRSTSRNHRDPRDRDRDPRRSGGKDSSRNYEQDGYDNANENNVNSQQQDGDGNITQRSQKNIPNPTRPAPKTLVDASRPYTRRGPDEYNDSHNNIQVVRSGSRQYSDEHDTRDNNDAYNIDNQLELPVDMNQNYNDGMRRGDPRNISIDDLV
eukprot:gene14034-18822_t